MRWTVIPENNQRIAVFGAELLEKGHTRFGAAVAIQGERLHLACLQADRRIVGDFLPQTRTGGIDQRGQPRWAHLPRRSASARKCASSTNQCFAPDWAASRVKRA